VSGAIVRLSIDAKLSGQVIGFGKHALARTAIHAGIPPFAAKRIDAQSKVGNATVIVGAENVALPEQCRDAAGR
jgi:hypothetical protein